jgi:hypothetical protein
MVGRRPVLGTALRLTKSAGVAEAAPIQRRGRPQADRAPEGSDRADFDVAARQQLVKALARSWR